METAKLDVGKLVRDIFSFVKTNFWSIIKLYVSLIAIVLVFGPID